MGSLVEQLRALAAFLAAGRPRILGEWRRRVDADPALASASSISRAQFFDHIPQVLDTFERGLSARDRAAGDEVDAQQRVTAGEHGLHRWQQGYNQTQTMREWVHLQLCLLDELEEYGAAAANAVDAATLRVARSAVAQLCGNGVCESAARYARLSQLEAAGRVRDLEQALQQLQSLERERAARWREAAHDLRGTVSVVTTAAAVLDREGVPEPARVQMSEVLQRGASSLHELLADLMDLARLEAGQERRNLVRFDVAQLVKEFCVPLRALAGQRNLFFRTEGVERLEVEGDPAKIQRIVQNLATNALKATASGGIIVTWMERTLGNRPSWILCVQDTGPGLDPRAAAPLERVLKQATDEAQDIEAQARESGQHGAKLDPAPTLRSRSSHEPGLDLGGEGIGLSIVKRLCELLEASLELETSPGAGTTFRVIFPRQYGVS